MIAVRLSEERGHGEFGWLSSRHSFSFANYYDHRYLGYRDLVVLNEDRVAAGTGFGSHSHRDMEIVSYVLSGALVHRDGLGNTSVLGPGEVQRMTAGTGIVHSEFNESGEAPLHFLQMWITPRASGLTPGYEQKTIPALNQPDRLALLVSPAGNDEAVAINQDVRILAARLSPGGSVDHPIDRGRHGWVQVARGQIDLNGLRLREGDGAAVSDETLLLLHAEAAAEVLLFDLR